MKGTDPLEDHITAVETATAACRESATTPVSNGRQGPCAGPALSYDGPDAANSPAAAVNYYFDATASTMVGVRDAIVAQLPNQLFWMACNKAAD